MNPWETASAQPDSPPPELLVQKLTTSGKWRKREASGLGALQPLFRVMWNRVREQILFVYFMCTIGFAYIYYVCCVHAVPLEAKRGCQISWCWSDTCLWVTELYNGVWGLKSGPYHYRETVPNHWPISPPPKPCQFSFQTGFPVSQADHLELTILREDDITLWSSRFYLLIAGVTSLSYHTWLFLFQHNREA